MFLLPLGTQLKGASASSSAVGDAKSDMPGSGGRGTVTLQKRKLHAPRGRLHPEAELKEAEGAGERRQGSRKVFLSAGPGGGRGDERRRHSSGGDHSHRSAKTPGHHSRRGPRDRRERRASPDPPSLRSRSPHGDTHRDRGSDSHRGSEPHKLVTALLSGANAVELRPKAGGRRPAPEAKSRHSSPPQVKWELITAQ